MLIQCNETMAAMKMIRQLLGNEVDTVGVDGNAEHMAIKAYNDKTGVSVNCIIPENKDEKDPLKFTVDSSMFNGILKSRMVIEGRMKNDSVEFRGVADNGPTSYKGTIAVSDYMELGQTGMEGTSVAKMNSESGIFGHIADSLKYIEINDYVMMENTPPVFVRIQDGRMICLCFDHIHAAIYEVTDIGDHDPVKFNVQRETLKKLSSLSKDAGFELDINDSFVAVNSPRLQATMVMHQDDMGMFEELLNYDDELKNDEKALVNTVINSGDVKKIVENFASILDDSVPVQCEMKPGELLFNYSTTYGTISEKFTAETKGEGSISIKASVLNDFVVLFPDADLRVSLHTVDRKRGNKKIKIILFRPDVEGTVQTRWFFSSAN